VVFVDAKLGTRDQVEAMAVQASLLAGGILDPAVVRRLTRRPARARRYLALEGHRALAAVEGVLPPSVRLLIDHDVAAPPEAPAAPLLAALSRGPHADPPDTSHPTRPDSTLTPTPPTPEAGPPPRQHR
jgi:hypothetical protein